MSNITTTLLILTVIVVLLPTETYAFGAGDIPDFAYLNDKAFRHGDIENILENIAKTAGHAAGGAGILGFAQSVLKSASGGAKFTRGDIKKVYFGNWLRDYSQAMDIAGLSKLTAESLVLVVSVLGFMTFGFATEEFQVTADRLGVYLPVEHIDNPKGYAEKEGDARQFHPKLRPPVDPRELEIDERTGMKKYMATENQGWDTSTALIRRTFRSCIEIGRRANGQEGADLWEAYRLLGTGLHTMEDLLAHSNWCEIALRKMGHQNVFCHVGDQVTINTPNGRAPPLVTGTFGGADFLHSLMGEATDKLSQASVTDLSAKMSQASQGDNSNVSALKNILSKLPIGGGDKMSQGESIHAQAKAYNFDPNNIAPPEVQRQLLALLKWRDGVYRDVLAKIEMVPGLGDLIEDLTNALNAYVYTVLAPWLTPILQQATSVLGEGSKAVIDSDDQFAVFDNPRASDPSHSLLSKDHFGLILNEPAGKIAQIVVEHSVNLIVKAWSDNSNPDETINRILEAFHHPYYATGRSAIQQQMFETMKQWFGGLDSDEARETLRALNKESVRNGKNKRLGSENEASVEPGYGGHSHGGFTQPKTSGSEGGYNSQQGQYKSPRTESHRKADRDENLQGVYGSGRNSVSSNREEGYGSRRYDDDSTNVYGSGRDTHVSSEREGYGSRRDNDDPIDTYGSSHNTYGSASQRQDGHNSRRSDEPTNTHVSGRNTYGSPKEEGYGSRRNDDSRKTYDSDSTQRGEGYGSTHKDEVSSHTYGSSRNTYGSPQRGGYTSRRSDDDSSNTYGSNTHAREPQEGYGSRRNDDEPSNTYGSGRTYGGSQRDEGYNSRHNDNESLATYGSGRKTYGSESQTEGYGAHRTNDEERSSYSSRSGYQPSYGRSEERSGGYGGGNTYSSSRTEESSYESFHPSAEGRYGGGRVSGGYDGGKEETSGYAPSYEGRNSGEETFGAERLNINNRGYGNASSRDEYESNY